MTQALVIGAGVVNIIPVVGVVSNARIEQLYGIEVTSAEIGFLLRHRAVLLGLVGAGLIISAFVPRHRLPAILLGLVSMGSYIGLYHGLDIADAQLGRVARIDVALMIAATVAAVLDRWSNRSTAAAGGMTP